MACTGREDRKARRVYTQGIHKTLNPVAEKKVCDGKAMKLRAQVLMMLVVQAVQMALLAWTLRRTRVRTRVISAVLVTVTAATSIGMLRCKLDGNCVVGSWLFVGTSVCVLLASIASGTLLAADHPAVAAAKRRLGLDGSPDPAGTR